MKRFIFIMLSVLISAMLFADVSTAQQKERARSHQGGGGDIERLLAAKDLDLSGEQRSQLEGIKAEFERERDRLRAESKDKREEIEALFKVFDVKAEDVARKVNELSALNSELLMKATMLRLKARRLLTEEQFKKAKALIEEIRER